MVVGVERIELEQAGHVDQPEHASSGCIQRLARLACRRQARGVQCYAVAAAEVLPGLLEARRIDIHQQYLGAGFQQLPGTRAPYAASPARDHKLLFSHVCQLRLSCAALHAAPL